MRTLAVGLICLSLTGCFLWPFGGDDETGPPPRSLLLGSGGGDEAMEGPCERNGRRYRAGTVVCADAAYECRPDGSWAWKGNC